MRFYAAMFLILGIALLLIPTANLKLEKESTGAAAGQALEEEAQEEAEQESDYTKSINISKNFNLKSKPESKPESESVALDQRPFRIHNLTTGEIDLLSQKDYVRAALCSEMPATFHLEALKAQAVAAHSYALHLQREAKKNDAAYDFSADPIAWKGYATQAQAQERFGIYFEEYWKKICQAADAVFDEVLLYEGAPIAAAYHAISAGKTEAAEEVWGNPVAYLIPVESPGDLRAAGYEETLSYSADALKNALDPLLDAASWKGEPGDWIQIKESSDSGYVTKLSIGGAPMSGLQFRAALGLRSSHFTLTQAAGTFTITTQGYGHGVGLSQYGADYMARQGADYQEILSHYYTNCEIA